MGLIILNSGLLHHVGSCLLSVRLARAAAQAGLLAIRFDFSGIGDSAPRSSTVDHEEQAVQETLEVLAYAKQKLGIEQFVLAGLCSGAFASFEAALKEDSVVGIVGIAPHSFRTRRWYLKHYLPRLFSPARWLKLMRQKLGLEKVRERYSAEFLEASASAGWSVPPRKHLADGYQTLLERGVTFLNFYTSGELVNYNYEGQMRDMFPGIEFADRLQEVFMPKARHIITEPVYQQAVLTRVGQWISANWGR